MHPPKAHRPNRRFPQAPRLLVQCPLTHCPHCHQPLTNRRTWHTTKTLQTLQGPLFVAGKSKECLNPLCSHFQQHYYASQLLTKSLPWCTYGLDVLAFIGWQHEHEHRQLGEIQRNLQQRGLLISERNVGKLYRQFLALLGGLSEKSRQRLAQVTAQKGGLILAIDALQPEGHGPLLYLLYEVTSDTPISAIQLPKASTESLKEWLLPYQTLFPKVLASLSDGEEAIIAAFKAVWPAAPHQRCQSHFLGNVAEEVLEIDSQFKSQLKQALGTLPKVPQYGEPSSINPVQSNQLEVEAENEVILTENLPLTPHLGVKFQPPLCPKNETPS